MARVSATGRRVEADAAVRARDLGESACVRDRERRRADRPRGACAEGDRPVEAAFLASAPRRRAARAAGRDDPALWSVAVAAWEALGRPYRAAQARRRKAEALLAAGERDAAAASALEALAAAHAIGAGWLASEIEGFALRARLRLEPDEPSPAPAQRAADAGEDPFGLTPRERQVLALLADGRTNREIGAAALHGREDRERPRLTDPVEARRALAHGGRGGRPPPGNRREAARPATPRAPRRCGCRTRSARATARGRSGPARRRRRRRSAPRRCPRSCP